MNAQEMAEVVLGDKVDAWRAIADDIRKILINRKKDEEEQSIAFKIEQKVPTYQLEWYREAHNELREHGLVYTFNENSGRHEFMKVVPVDSLGLFNAPVTIGVAPPLDELKKMSLEEIKKVGRQTGMISF